MRVSSFYAHVVHNENKFAIFVELIEKKNQREVITSVGTYCALRPIACFIESVESIL